MRALFTVQPSVGHLHPLVPVAEALSEAGHQVAVCSAAAFRSEVEAFGLTHIDAGLDWHTSDRSTWEAFPPMPPPGPEFAAFVVTMFADVTTRHMVPDLLAVGREWQPDLVIRESMEYGGCIAAERLGIPHASIAGNGYSAVDSPTISYFPGNRLAVSEPLARHREEVGLPADPDVQMPFRYLHLCFTPPRWDGVSVSRPRNTHFLRHTSAILPGARLPEWVGQPRDRPTVLASLGTVFNKTPGVLDAIVEGLRDETVNLIVAIGRDQDPARFGPQPAHVRLEAYVHQPLLLPHCDVFVTHGGFNSVKESLSVGVPMVVVPVTADQPYCAERCAALGVARTVGGAERSAEAIREAVVGPPRPGLRRQRPRAAGGDERTARPGPHGRPPRGAGLARCQESERWAGECPCERAMIARLGHFADFDHGGRAYVVEAVGDLPGFRGVYHLVERSSGRALSVSFWDSSEAAAAGERAVGRARRAGAYGGASPELVETWEVVRHRFAP